MRKAYIFLTVSLLWTLFCFSCVTSRTEVMNSISTNAAKTQTPSPNSSVEPVVVTPEPIPATPTPTPEPTPTLEPEVFYDGIFEYYVKDGEAIVSGCIRDWSLEIPALLGGFPVTGIGEDAFSNNMLSMDTVVLPNTIKTIGDRAFYYTGLTTIKLPDSVTTIGNEAFAYCDLQSIVLPNSLSCIGDYAFFQCDLKKLVIPEGVTSIGKGAFQYNRELTSLKLPSTVEHIGANIIDGSWKPTSVTLSSANKYFIVRDDALLSSDGTILFLCLYTDNMEIDKNDVTAWLAGEYTIPEGVKKIASQAFSYSMNLDVYVPQSDMEIEESAFPATSHLRVFITKDNQAFQLLNGALTNGKGTLLAYRRSSLSNADYYQVYDAYGEASETDYSIYDGTVRIGSHAFEWQNENPKTINIPDSVTSIGDYAFYASAIIDLLLPDSVAEIGEYAFSRSDLKEVTLNGTLTKISKGMFTECNFTNITIPDNITRIEDEAFRNCSITKITVPDSIYYIGKRAFMNSDLIEADLPGNLERIEDEAFRSCLELAAINLPDSVQYIGDSAFSGCELLEEVAWPSQIKRIGSNAFARCSSLKEVYLPDGLTNIDYGAFFFCDSITNIEVPGSVKTIGPRAFYGCVNLKTVKISDGVEYIGDGVFENCDSLTSITIPPSVTSIGKDALGNDDFGGFYNDDLVVHTTEGSYASQYASERGIPCVIN